MSHQKANMIKELRCYFQSARLLMIKQSLAALKTVSLSKEDMWMVRWIMGRFTKQICAFNSLDFIMQSTSQRQVGSSAYFHLSYSEITTAIATLSLCLLSLSFSRLLRYKQLVRGTQTASLTSPLHCLSKRLGVCLNPYCIVCTAGMARAWRWCWWKASLVLMDSSFLFLLLIDVL